MADSKKTFETAEKRWEGIGPYYAMFPIRFADAVINEYTEIGDTVLDPFAGRGTSVFSATSQGRRGVGIEISPVGWVYAATKLSPAPLKLVERRLLDIAGQADKFIEQIRDLPNFFRMCFSDSVLSFLLAARESLEWRRRVSDRTLMAILLVYLHGKEGQALSNQMRQTKAMSPQYAVKWWVENGKKAPEIDPVEFMRQRIRWRYAKGTVRACGSRVLLGDSVDLIPQLGRHLRNKGIPKAKLLFTSPPYFGVTNYHYDQWLRLWLLGFETDAYVTRGRFQGRFTHPTHYKELLLAVFRSAANLVARDAVIYIRTSREPVTKQATYDAILSAFPGRPILERLRPFRKPTQTHLFGDKEPKTGEVDMVLLPR